MGVEGDTAASSVHAVADASFARALHVLASIERDDGVLSQREKQTIAVALAAVCDPERLGDETKRAVGCGVTAEQLGALARALFLSRGERPARAVLDAARAEHGDLPFDRSPSTSPPAPVTEDEMLAAFSAAFGELPPRVRLLAEHSPAGLEAYHRMRMAVLGDNPLTVRLAEIVLFAVNAAEHRADFASVHARGARTAGATTGELVEAGLTTISFGGVAAWFAASQAIED